MRSGLAAGALSLLVFSLAFLGQTGAPSSSSPASIPRGGAWKAFEWWYGQRAHPYGLIPRDGLRKGHDRAREIRRNTLAQRERHRGLTSASSPSSSSWTSIGPANIGGRVLAIAVHPVSTQRVFVGSASGGLWRTESGGTGPAPWTRVETGYPTISVSAIAIDPLHPDTIYIGTGEISRYVRPLVGTLGARASYGLGILRSTDGGVTWDTTGLSWAFQNVTAVQKIVVNPLNTSTVFAATSEGVYRSHDAGKTWSLSNGELMAMDIVINPSDTTILISSHGNLNSTANPGLYMTFDAGASWSKLQGGLPTVNFGRTALALSPSDPSVVWAGIANGSSSSIIGLYRSTNGGLTWSLRSSVNYVGSQGWYDNTIAVHPTDPSVVYAAGFDIHKSSDAAQTLPVISSGAVHVDHHAIAFDPSNPQVVYFGTDGGIYKTTDGGTTFLDLNDGFLTTQFYPGFANASDDSTIALGGLQDNGTLKYIGTDEWIPIWGGDGGWCAIDPTNKNTVYAESQYGRIVRSYTGGSAFALVTLGLPSNQQDWNFIPPFVIAPSAPSILYAGSRTVYKTTNYGTSWFSPSGSPTLNGTTVACIGVSPTSPDTLLAGTGSGTFGVSPLFQIFRSTTGGASWTHVTGSLPNRYPTDIEFDPSNSSVVYLTYSGYGTSHVFRSTDAGLTWSDIGAGLPDIPHQCIVVDPVYPHYLYVGTDLGVFQSSDAGASWTSHSDGMPDAMVLDLTVSRSNDALRASTFGNGVYQRPLPRFPVLTLTYPVGNEILVAGLVERIRWSQEYTPQVRIEFSADGGGSWSLVADSVDAAAGHHDWTVPEVSTEEGRIKITHLAAGSPSDSSLLPFSIVVDPDLLGGWNMVSVPVQPSSWLKDSLFPTAVSSAFEYSKGYVVRDTLASGMSFWLKFPVPQFTDLQGSPITTDSVTLFPGWNMIGSISTPLPTSDIIEQPPNVLLSQVYAYRKGYSVADTLLPGRGYWVKAASAGSLVMTGPSLAAPSRVAAGADAPSGDHRPAPNALTVSDATGFSQTLHFGAAQLSAPGRDLELPPAPPAPSPDVRFASGRRAETLAAPGAAGSSAGIRLSGLRAPLQIRWSVADGGYLLEAGERHLAALSGNGRLSLDAVPAGLTLIRSASAAAEAPRAFRLLGNYPNPFNPATTIAYRLETDARVRLAVYDNLGREVALLADGPEPAGERSRSWDAAGNASGIYFCRLTVDGESVTAKMLLLR